MASQSRAGRKCVRLCVLRSVHSRVRRSYLCVTFYARAWLCVCVVNGSGADQTYSGCVWCYTYTRAPCVRFNALAERTNYSETDFKLLIHTLASEQQ